jgi:histidinol-phosphate aminotransferase
MNFNKELESITTYEGGKPIELVVREFGVDEKDVIKLASNENPNGVSPKVVKKVQEKAHLMSQYPDDSMYRLKRGLSKRFGVNEKNIIIGAGSDQVIEFAVRAKANHNKGILTAGITFAMYEIYAKQVGAKVFKTGSITHDLDEFLELYLNKKDEIGIIFLCLPNNPLGESLPTKDVYAFLEKIDEDTLVVVDGAYQEYASFKSADFSVDAKELIEKFSNTLYLGTFSKAYGLGGMRVGYGIADETIIKNLYKLRPPFNITTLTLEASIEALKDEKFVKDSIELNFKEMKKYENFAKENKISFINSFTNFITLIFNEKFNSKEIANILLQQGIIVRDLTSYGLNAIRVTIGKPEQNDIFLERFKKILG